MPATRATGTELTLSLVGYALASIVFTWPLVTGLGSKLPIDLGDPILTSWLMAWGQEGMTRGFDGIMNAPMFFPSPLAFAFTENLLGLAIPLSPVWFLTHNAALVGGLALLICFTLNGFTAYLLARELNAAPLGAAIAGAVYAFAPYRIAQISHLHVEATFWIPLLIIVLLRLAEEPSLRKGVTAGLILFLQALTSLNAAGIAALAVGLMLPFILWRAGKAGWLRAAGSLALGGSLAALLILPVALPLMRAREVYPIEPTSAELALYSADYKSFATTTPWHLLTGEATDFLRDPNWSEKVLYPSVMVLVLAMAGAWTIRKRPQVWAPALLLGIGGLIVAFGPSANGMKLPYGFAVDIFPILTLLRVPTRAFLLVLLALGIIASAVKLPARLGLLFAAVITLEFLAIPLPMKEVPEISPGYRWLASQDGAVIELPAIYVWNDEGHWDFPSHRAETAAMYRQTAHWRPVANGYSSHLPERYLDLMREMLTFPDTESMHALTSDGIRWVVIHPDELGGTPWEGLDRKIEGMNVRLNRPEMIVIDVGAPS